MQIKDLPELLEPANTDKLVIQDAQGITKRITREKFLTGVSAGESNGNNNSSSGNTFFRHFHDESVILNGNPLARGYNYSYQNPGQLGDEFSFKYDLVAGNYRLGILFYRYYTRGILSLFLNDNLIFDNLDMYGTESPTEVLLRDITVPSSATQNFRFKVTGTNPSSGAYYAIISKFWAYKL
jgi:hypothetical protein